MFKLSKGTHFTIIGTFAVVFIVIYLYYTITDVRRLQLEVSMLSKKVASLQAPPAEHVVVSEPARSEPPVIFLNHPGNVCVDDVCKMVVDNNADGDASSVETVEIKKILSMCDGEGEGEEQVTETGDVPVEEQEFVEVVTPAVAPEKPKVTRGRKPTK